MTNQTFTYTVRYVVNNDKIIGVSWPDTTHTYSFESNLATGKDTQIYKFVEWNTEPDGSGTSYASGETVVNLSDTPGDIIFLFAIWALKNLTKIYLNGTWKNAKAYVYMNGTWKLTIPHVYKGDIRLLSSEEYKLNDCDNIFLFAKDEPWRPSTS